MTARTLTALCLLLAGCAAPPASSAGAQALRDTLPASFTGILPCSDCDGVRTQLDLWPDGVFHLQREYVGKPGRDDDRGRWRRVPDRDVLLLYGGREMPTSFELRGSDALAPLDALGRPAGDSRAELRRLPAFTPADVRTSLHGMFRYLADAASFEECLTGRHYPVAMEGDYLALEGAYLAAALPEPGAPIMASFDGEIARRPAMEGDAQVPTVVVTRFVGLWPGQRCERALARASLADNYWRVVSLRGQALVTGPGQREAHLILHGHQGRYRGGAGCETFAGTYRVDGERIAFDAPAPTGAQHCDRGARSSGADSSALRDVLVATHRWAIHAQFLELFDARGSSIALFEAVYLR